MERLLPHVSILSLQEMALRRFAVHLWTEPCTLVSVRNFTETVDIDTEAEQLGCVDLNVWKDDIESKVLEKISKVWLPESLAKEMIRVIKNVGSQIKKWKLFHEFYLSDEYLDVPVLEKLQWTSAGTVDDRNTAEEIVRSDVFDIVKRYKLACLYCLDQYIPGLWKELPQDTKLKFIFKGPTPFMIPSLSYYWPFFLQGEEYKLYSMSGHQIAVGLNNLAFQRSSFQGIKAATQYFLQKLSTEDREYFLMRAANEALEPQGKIKRYPFAYPRMKVSDVVFYLLSEMTTEQQLQIMRERPAEVLGCFFDWPWQEAFLDFSNAIWTWMQCEDKERRARNYNTLLNKLQFSVLNSDYYLPTLFQNVLMGSPSDFRKYFVKQECRRSTQIFTGLFSIQDAETLKIILCHLDAGNRLRLVSSRHVVELFHCFIKSGTGHLVERCLRKIELSKKEKARLKKAVVEFLKCNLCDSETPGFRKFFEFLDETDARAQTKRSSDDEKLSEAKKLCCEK